MEIKRQGTKRAQLKGPSQASRAKPPSVITSLGGPLQKSWVLDGAPQASTPLRCATRTSGGPGPYQGGSGHCGAHHEAAGASASGAGATAGTGDSGTRTTGTGARAGVAVCSHRNRRLPLKKDQHGRHSLSGSWHWG